MEKQTDPQRTELESAIESWASEQGDILRVYEEFLLADLLLISSEGSPEPVLFEIEGQPKQQIWVCTRPTAVPDFAPGTTRVSGYGVLPLLMDRNVHIATGEGIPELMLIGHRALAVSAPEITGGTRAEALRVPGTWLPVPDRMFGAEARENLPEHAFVGEYWVDESGHVTSTYRPNPSYRPSPLTLGFPEPESTLESVLHLHKAGHVSDATLVSVMARSAFYVATGEDGVIPMFSRGDTKVAVAASSEKYVPEAAAAYREVTCGSIEPVLRAGDLEFDVGARHHTGVRGSLLAAELERAAGESGGAGPPQPPRRRSVPEVHDEVRPPPPRSPRDAHERFMGAMVAGAVGDALGFGIEFQPIDVIRRTHGEAGLTTPVLRDGVAQVSDDTQMMVFTLEGLIRAHVARRIEPTDNDPVPEVQHAYLRWLHTQNRSWGSAGGPYARRIPRPDGWLITHPGLFAVRAPGNTCLTALVEFTRTGRPATFDNRANNSKGCGGVMRAAPAAVWSNDPAEVFHAAAGTAALTHGHPSGFLPAGVLATILHQVLRDVLLRDSVRLARELLVRWRENEETTRALDRAVELADRGPLTPEDVEAELGQGWVGEEALAIGVHAVLATDNLRDAMVAAVNHSGDSDSTGIVCGNIAGAVYGPHAIPQTWLAPLEMQDVIIRIAQDALTEFSPDPPTDAAWTQRYPAW